MNPNIVVIGSLNMDIVINVEEMPHEGQTILGTGFSEIAGGKGANQAVAIGKLQASVGMIGKVGADSYASALLDSLKESNVDARHILTSPNRTGVALVTVNQSGKNHIVVVPGANFDLTPDDIRNQRHVIEQCEMVVLQLEVPMETVNCALQLAKEAGKTTILNPAPAKIMEEEMLKNVDILIPNEHELSEISGMEIADERSLQEAARSLLAKGVKAVLVTLGDKGCCYVDKDRFQLYPAHQVKAKDTTAAGDSFIGGFTASYVKNRDIDMAVKQAQIVAAITVTRPGAQSSLPTLEEVQRFAVDNA
ncbi:ribokinase [Paenibacillus validus]|uniref:Ribokinase n=1 Tax=Paenibacillus validus TaxID=44253 RepID=A0A7X2ZBQ0_9BACL|nr:MULTISPECIES: ribokinase [Paenibacillus]MED4599405.1 ribokinase [Paenibacillus validus]MED4605117.1 ribokinase [Paenibacillus validus]MUG72028.1 ribokinase [Paenibacillus validus]